MCVKQFLDKFFIMEHEVSSNLSMFLLLVPCQFTPPLPQFFQCPPTLTPAKEARWKTCSNLGIQMEATEQFFPMELCIMLCKGVVSFDSVAETQSVIK